MTSKQLKINLLYDMLEDAETYGDYEPEDDDPTIDDLSESEIDELYDQLVEKLKRPRRPIGRI